MTFGLDTPSVSTVRDKWGWFLALGILLLLFGFLALANLFVATVASVFYIGMMMLTGGVAYLVHAFQVKGWDHILFWAASGILYTIAGLLAFWNPALTAVIVTFFMAVALIVAGIFRLWVGFRMRPMRGSGWVIFGGVITALAGLVIALGWPVNSLWILGLFLAIDLTMQGWALVAVALAAKP
ncbi:HdeD family acid-resistance protein [Neorhizobium galegae]|uniref:HdeD family acid-resistance protein n=1 Tax=Neorhizobium galegae TaxID=399 RepID=UPI0006216B83|nr:HdeD family acid-resistance protein [Neorhizobium galegae]CDZ29497.1 HdeD protein [Neorhizobium galegae bv. officinalis]KAA9386250.1 HdeD family acid-resistance protein [Neorhizobium galegae]KAB1113306.1 HdeD family acid-resistance protein [Neorhizobium galegae]MCM2496252.1 HdeD family acid-resistance protein [Neorhizobium galegae]MCQ1770612.1 HdeD family acid-resistance protein [Neorhizobium galegae]